jgi:glycine reductase
MVKELEEVVDVPVVHVCTVVPISLTVGANRIDPAIAIPYPLGNPQLNQEEEFALRRSIVEKALQALTTEISEQTVF